MNAQRWAIVIAVALLLATLAVAYTLPRFAFRSLRRAARVLDWSVDRVTRGV